MTHSQDVTRGKDAGLGRFRHCSFSIYRALREKQMERKGFRTIILSQSRETMTGRIKLSNSSGRQPIPEGWTFYIVPFSPFSFQRFNTFFSLLGTQVLSHYWLPPIFLLQTFADYVMGIKCSFPFLYCPRVSFFPFFKHPTTATFPLSRPFALDRQLKKFNPPAGKKPIFD